MFKKLLAFLLSIPFLALYIGADLLVYAEDSVVPPPPDEEQVPGYYLQTFIITAYYSPLAGQERYVTGSYEGDIRLNGNGTNGADGTPVFPGMIAAPKTYPFGLKIYIPGIGMTSVHDRGGAIVSAGNKGNTYDRLDIWMGYGDEGLRAALGWGKRTVEARVYGIQEDISEAVYFEDYLTVENIYTETFLSDLTFTEDIYYGSSGDEVLKMQNYLVDWGYLDEANGFYGSDTAQALFNFQMDYSIVSDPNELGAGHFGPQTRRAFQDLIDGKEEPQVNVLQEGYSLMLQYPDLMEEREVFTTALGLGDSGESVRLLQEELQNLGFLRIDPTGYYGETTAHAVFKFQQARGLLSSEDETGAGYLGPQTRELLNAILESRYETKSLLAYQRAELDSGRLALMLPDAMLASLQKEEILLP